jgi:hypothetical protein
MESVTFDATTSTVPQGAASQFRWTFGDDVVLHSAATVLVHGGRWKVVSDPTAAGGSAIENADNGEPKITTALANPASYVELTFRAAAGVPYRLWMRMRADRDSYSNDSVHVQFSGSVSATGAAVTRIGSQNSLGVFLEEGGGAGVQGWGWGDSAYGGLGAPIYFNQDGIQKIRIQQREDGIRIDQIVISANAHFDGAPGAAKADTTIVPVSGPGATGSVVGHVYRTAGTYPVTVTVAAGSAGTATDSTVAAIR